MSTKKNCKHCGELFQPRRSNHIYCKTSCKTLASYKRNNYKYVPGHYMTEEVKTQSNSNIIPLDNNISELMKKLESKIESIEVLSKNNSSIKNNALGSVTADAGIYLAKKLLTPHLLPANKGDVDVLRNELKELKELLRPRNNNPFS